MRLVEFLTAVLHCYADSLIELSELFGESVLVEIMEAAGDREIPLPEIPAIPGVDFMPPAVQSPSGEALSQLENAIEYMHVPKTLEFYLWSYPYYRTFIESHLELDYLIRFQSPEAETAWIDAAILESKRWLGTLALPPAIAAKAEKAIQGPWLKLRTYILRKGGKRPLSPVT